MVSILEKLGDAELKIEQKINSVRGKGGDRVPDLDQAEQAPERKLADRDKVSNGNSQRDDALRRIADNASREPEHLHSRYGDLPESQICPNDVGTATSTSLKDLNSVGIGTEVTFRARLHTRRRVGTKLVFFVFRQQTVQVQGVLSVHKDTISENMVLWAEHVPPESIVVVYGVLQRPAQEIRSANVHDIEVLIQRIYTVSQPTKSLPFNVYHDESAHTHAKDTPVGQQHEQKLIYTSDRTRLDNQILNLRNPASQTIFRVKAAVCNIFRSFLDSKGFVEIQTPKLQSAAAESGSSVFEVKYFGRPAFLAQSPQLSKQMAIASDFERVYEIGPAFRAENSNTHRHLTEYTSMDLEMTIDSDYHEMLVIVDDMFKSLWKGIYDRFGDSLSGLEARFPHEKLVWLDKTPRIPFADGVRMLRDSGWTDEEGQPPADDEDLSTKAEIRLGELVKEKFKTDYYILDKFPASARPFYTMPDPDAEGFTNSFDIMLRGQEILSGGQRIHDAAMLEHHMRKAGLIPETLDEYLEAFRLATHPHAGAGIGLERVVMLLLNLGDVRWSTLSPRDPRSFPEMPKVYELRHTGSNTLEFDAESMKHFPLEELIANYGDAANSSWLDERYHIWRHPKTSAAQGYVPSNNRVIVVGEPLCDESQFVEVISAFLDFVDTELKVKPIWILVGFNVEEILGLNFEWHTLSCCAEDRAQINDSSVIHDPTIRKKIRQAEREQIKIVHIPQGEGERIDDAVRPQIDDRIKEWRKNRSGSQIALTTVDPWKDMAHRHYVYAKDKDGKICVLVVLHQLATKNGFQVKFALDFPGAPSGAIEATTLRAMEVAGEAGAERVTFGSSAAAALVSGQHMNSMKVKVLAKIYASIAEKMKLTQKGDFRDKMGAKEDPVFVCYPSGAMGALGMKALMDFLQAEE